MHDSARLAFDPPLQLTTPVFLNLSDGQVDVQLTAAMRTCDVAGNLAQTGFAAGGRELHARDSAHRAKSGGFEFTYGYQRADLNVRGPPIYDSLGAANGPVLQETLYTGSGMSAMAALLTALQRLHSVPELLVPEGCYRETLEKESAST